MVDEDTEPLEINFQPQLIAEAEPIKRKADKPPKVDEDYTPSKPRGRRPQDIKTIEDGLTQAFGMVGMALSMVNLYDAMVIHENAELLAAHWTKVAEANPKVKKWMLNALQGGTWAGAISVTFAVAVPIAVHHGALPEEMEGMTKIVGVKVPTPEEKLQLERASNNGDSADAT